MKSIAVGQHAHQLIRFGLINTYLLQESDSATLIDTAIRGTGKHLLTAAASLNARIGRILLTHAHVDHAGSVDELVASAGTPPLPLAIGTRESRLLQQPPDKSLDPGEPQGELKGGFNGTRTRPTHLLSEGELFGSLRVLGTPGHTPGHVSFFDERDGTLYAGDALVCVGGKLHVVGFGPWFFPLPAAATWNKNLALQSAERLLSTLGSGVRRYAAGHGRLIEGGPALLEQAIGQARRSL